MPSSGSAVRQIGFCILALVAAALIIGGALTWQANHRLAGKLTALKKAGDPTLLAELAPNPIPAEKNAAAYLQSITADLEAFSKDDAAFADTPDGTAYEDAQQRGELPSEKQLAAIRVILDRYPRILPALNKAAQCESYASLLDFNLPQDQFLASSLNSYSPKRNLALYVRWKMMTLLKKRKAR